MCSRRRMDDDEEEEEGDEDSDEGTLKGLSHVIGTTVVASFVEHNLHPSHTSGQEVHAN